MPANLSPRIHRRLLIVAAVLAFHVMGLWALQNGLLGRAVERVIPVQVMAELIEAPSPEIAPAPASPLTDRPRQAVKPRSPPKPAAVQPVAIADPPPSPVASTGVMAPDPAPHAPAAPAQVELPSSSADYLNNPRPPYPLLSRRLGEQGEVIVRVFIETDGIATRAEIGHSSGFDRLNQAALQAVLKWRYLPGKRHGVPVAMWFNVPIRFVLE